MKRVSEIEGWVLPTRLVVAAAGGVVFLEGVAWAWETAAEDILLLRLLQAGWMAFCLMHAGALRMIRLQALDQQAWWVLVGGLGAGALLAGLLLVLRPNFLYGLIAAVPQQPRDWLLQVFVAPVSEELFFRGILYVFLRQLVGMPLALAGSALIFQWAHGAWFGPQLLGGLGFATVYEWGRNLWVPILLHALGNLTLIALALYVAV